jgi:hypothetical protein
MALQPPETETSPQVLQYSFNDLLFTAAIDYFPWKSYL